MRLWAYRLLRWPSSEDELILVAIAPGHIDAPAFRPTSVRSTTTEALAHRVVAPAIAALRRSHPALQVDLMVGVRTLDIARRDADLAVRFARPTAPELICRKLAAVGYSLYASRRYLAKRGVPKRAGGLADTNS